MENKLPENLHFVAKYAPLHTPKKRLHASGTAWGPAQAQQLFMRTDATRTAGPMLQFDKPVAGSIFGAHPAFSKAGKAPASTGRSGVPTATPAVSTICACRAAVSS